MPEADLINSSNALPFCRPDKFATVWHLIFALLRPGGHSFQTRKEAYKRWPVPIFVAGAYVRIVTDDGQLLRALTLDPTRGYEPLGGRWPVHNVLQQVSTMS